MYHILYVDDEWDLLEITKLFLENSKEFTIDVSTSAKDVLKSASLSSYDAIISDYLMPDLDGITFLKEVRSRFGTIPFILFTGKGREEIVIEAINSGADFYVQKGGDPKAQYIELAHKVRQAVKGYKSDLSLRESEEKFRSLVEHALEGIVILDLGGTILFANDAAARTIEADDGKSLIGRNVMEFIAPESREEVARDFMQVANGHDGYIATYILP
jgi:DNA-binding response OmpR family regulator